MNPIRYSVRILGGGAALLLLFLGIGYLLPTDWEADAEAHVAAPAEAVYAFLDSPEGWHEWTPWPDSGVVRSGPDRGAGASLQWDDRELGSGSFTLVEASPPRHVTYTVEVGEGAMRTEGRIEVVPDADGVRVTWREEGDLGRNPLMGYWALSMGRAQSEELAKGLERLSTLATSPAPAEDATSDGDRGPPGA